MSIKDMTASEIKQRAEAFGERTLKAMRKEKLSTVIVHNDQTDGAVFENLRDMGFNPIYLDDLFNEYKELEAENTKLKEQLVEFDYRFYDAQKNAQKYINKELFNSANHIKDIEAANKALSLEIVELRKAINDHNQGCLESCNDRSDTNLCKDYKNLGRYCTECPRDWVIETNSEAGS